MKSSEPLRGFSGSRRYTLTVIPPLPQPVTTALAAGRLTHALCLEAPSPALLRDTAIALAGALLCRSGDGSLCGTCPACRKVLVGEHPDLMLYDPDEDKDIYKKESLRRMRELAPGHTEEELNRALLRCGGSPETGAALLRDPAAQKRYAAAEEMLAGLAMANPYRVIAAAAPLEKDRAGYTALLETLAELLANPALREMYNLPGRAAAGCRAQIAPLLQMCERNAHLPLVTALLTERCRR